MLFDKVFLFLDSDTTKRLILHNLIQKKKKELIERVFEKIMFKE